jgi:hypothetical protein
VALSRGRLFYVELRSTRIVGAIKARRIAAGVDGKIIQNLIHVTKIDRRRVLTGGRF